MQVEHGSGPISVQISGRHLAGPDTTVLGRCQGMLRTSVFRLTCLPALRSSAADQGKLGQLLAFRYETGNEMAITCSCCLNVTHKGPPL